MNRDAPEPAREELAVVLAGAGEGVRMGGRPKLLLEIDGRTLLGRVVSTFVAHPAVGEIVAAVPAGSGELASRARAILETVARERGVRVSVIPGGATRQRSVAAALRALTRDLPFIAVHDVARALVQRDLVTRVLDAARRSGAAIPVLPIRDTIKEVEGDRVTRTVPREGLAGAQTPQIFTRDIMLRAIAAAEAAGFEATDDAALVEETGTGVVTAVPGDPTNLKLTEPSDVTLFEALVRSLDHA
ncbi:MAG TPA: 2-C-methyl-D-erythritol 4-phosphate cytidylyltransferase [Candidatus Eisenbacteria bacterium]|nr:2-C-methyl-D-erythritol 4-phosphate cytidylyltransferase [Candidatus Eisenbacteria bacterium]